MEKNGQKTKLLSAGFHFYLFLIDYRKFHFIEAGWKNLQANWALCKAGRMRKVRCIFGSLPVVQANRRNGGSAKYLQEKFFFSELKRTQTQWTKQII